MSLRLARVQSDIMEEPEVALVYSSAVSRICAKGNLLQILVKQ